MNLIDTFPDTMQGAIERYVTKGIPPGSFLTAIICNDLTSAVMHADRWNLPLIPDYVRYFYNDVPGLCWGSREKMNAWMEAGGSQGRAD